MPENAHQPASLSESLPSQNIRTVVSLILFVHLFAIAVALVANAGNTSSRLLDVIRQRLLRQYLYATWMDVGYRYHYMEPRYDLEAELVAEDGTQMKVAVEPRARGLRKQRFQRLGYSIAGQQANPNRAGLLPAMVGGGLLKRKQGQDQSVLVACLELLPKPANDFRETGELFFPPQTLYRARVALLDGEGRVLEKFEERGQVPSASRSPATEPNLPATSSSQEVQGLPPGLPPALQDLPKLNQ